MATRRGNMEDDDQSKPAAAETETKLKDPADQDSYDPNEELWEGGPTLAQVEEWKKQYAGVYVTLFDPNTYVVWRAMNRFEYRNLVKTMEQSIVSGQISQAEATLNNDEAVAELCTLYPKYNRANPAGAMAGLASTIAQQVMDASGFTSLDVRSL